MSWLSPVTGRALHPDTPHSLSDGAGERWPVLEGIPYLRTERNDLIARTLGQLDAGDTDAALVTLLADQDPHWSGPATDPADLAELVARRGSLSLRAAMALLRFGPVADYFAHRWSDPTYLAGLALLAAHWNAPAHAFELAGGIGHYSRELTRQGVSCLSADIVFAKCWLGKNWVAPAADYVVFDAKDRWPMGLQRFDLVHCQDAFYFFPNQREVAARLRQAVADGGTLAIGHLHNAAVAGGALGPARRAEDWRALFPDATVYDEGELRAALLSGGVPRAAGWVGDATLEAWSLVEGGGAPHALTGDLVIPAERSHLSPNPLIGDDGPNWPSDRYAREYGGAATWLDPDDGIAPERARRVVDLPERW